MPNAIPRWTTPVLLVTALCMTPAHGQGRPPAARCQASSTATAPTVLELYTSEGCSSCPPADRWLSSLKDRSDVLPLAFHVTYWDRLGWPDRFALPEGTTRQHQLAKLAGSRQVYTPQVVANGQDWPQWHRASTGGPLSARAAAGPQSLAPASLTLRREGSVVEAQIPAAPGSAAAYAGYWAVVEDGHESQVRAGENAGTTLRHDHVVRLYQPVTPWAAGTAATHRLQAGTGVPQHPRRVVFVVTDAASHKPVQAVALAC